MKKPIARILRGATLYAAMLAAPSSFASSLTAATSNSTGLFTSGATVALTFHATGASGETLKVTFQDVHGNVVATETAAVTSDPWSGSVTGPSTNLGFYRVYGQLTDGTTIAPAGSNAQADGKPSFATYAVVPDPSQRRATITDAHAFFGLAGGFGVGNQILSQLGVRWIKESQWSWAAMEPTANERNTFAPNPGSAVQQWTNGSSPWVAFSLPNLTFNGRPYAGTPDVCVPGTFAYNTCAIGTEYDQDWQTFAAHVATNWPVVYPSRAHRYYEVTWEPIYPWGYLGTPAEFVSLYELAHAAMKAADPTALLVGPTMFVEGQPGNADDVIAAGLAPYLDVFSTHPYVINDIGYYGASLPEWGYWDPELAGLPSRIATQGNVVAAAAGKPLPTFGTEQGYPTHQQSEYEIDQARRLVRQNLILLGMGWQTNIAFYFADYVQGTDSQWMNTTTTFWDYGLFYNLDESSYGGYLPTTVSPKPIAAAYAAMTFLLDDRKAVNDVNWLTDTTRGYVYESYDDATDEVMALWDFSGSSVQVSIAPGVASVQVYDWMGNASTVMTGSNGTITLTLTNEPTYVKGVSAAVWGSARHSVDVALGKSVTTSGDASVDGGTSSGSLAVDGDPWANESRWISSSDANDKWIVVDLGTPTVIDEVRFFTGQYTNGAHANVYGNAVPSYHVQQFQGSSWVDIVLRSSNTHAAVDEVFAPVTTSQVRLYFDANGTTGQVKLYELEVMSPSGGALDAGIASGDSGSSTTSADDAGRAGSSGKPISPMRAGDAGTRSFVDGGASLATTNAETAAPSSGGCSASGSRGTAQGSWLLASFASLLLARRRRARSLAVA